MHHGKHFDMTDDHLYSFGICVQDSKTIWKKSLLNEKDL